MKKHLRWGLLIVLCVLFLSPSLANADQDTLTTVSLEEAIQLAYKNNPDIRKADLELEKAQILRNDARKHVDYIPIEGLVSPQYQQVFNNYQQAEIGLSVARKTYLTEQERVNKEVISTYAQAVKNYNAMENMQLTLKDMETQKRIAAMGMSLGLISELNYEKIDMANNKVQEGYKATQASYESSIASLRYLLGRSMGWNPVLTSRAVLNNYPRNELSVELNRGTSESAMVWTQKALLDIENSKKYWTLPNLSSEMQKINLNMAEVNYEQANRDAKALIEKLYYGINAIEGQIQVADNACRIAEKDLQIAQLKFDVGIIPRYSMINGDETLSGAELGAQKARLELENLKADLVMMKSDFAYLTGQTVYNPNDWDTTNE